MQFSPTYSIRAAAAGDVPELAGLFDAYRVFYDAASLPEKAEAFVRGIVAHHRTRFFVAREAGGSEAGPILGFIHLIPSINTVAMKPIWYLEDLYVVPSARRDGVATALMRFAEGFANDTGAERLTLATAHNNRKAHSLYKRLGYVRDEHFWYYHRVLQTELPEAAARKKP